MKSKNINTLTDFYIYCLQHPEQRFWQALRNWSGYEFIYGFKEKLEDTFYIDEVNDLEKENNQ